MVNQSIRSYLCNKQKYERKVINDTIKSRNFSLTQFLIRLKYITAEKSIGGARWDNNPNPNIPHSVLISEGCREKRGIAPVASVLTI